MKNISTLFNLKTNDEIILSKAKGLLSIEICQHLLKKLKMLWYTKLNLVAHLLIYQSICAIIKVTYNQ